MTFSLMTFRSFSVISRESCDPSITTFDTASQNDPAELDGLVESLRELRYVRAHHLYPLTHFVASWIRWTSAILRKIDGTWRFSWVVLGSKASPCWPSWIRRRIVLGRTCLLEINSCTEMQASPPTESLPLVNCTIPCSRPWRDLVRNCDVRLVRLDVLLELTTYIHAYIYSRDGWKSALKVADERAQ
jgi:hypothetical protein